MFARALEPVEDARSTNGPSIDPSRGQHRDLCVLLPDDDGQATDDFIEAVHVESMETVTIGKPLDTRALAEFLGVPARTIEYWRARKPEPYGPRFWYAGKKVLYSPEDVKDWVDEQRGKRGAA